MTRKRWILFVVAVGVVAASMLALTVYSTYVSAPRPFHGSLEEMGTVHSVASGRGAWSYVLFKLTYSSPSTLGASGILLTVYAPPNGSIRLWGGSMVPFAQLPYNADMFPPWLTALPGNGIGGPFSATCTNPNGEPVSGVGPNGSPQATTETLLSGALLNVTFDGDNGPLGLTIEVSHDGNPGVVETVIG